MTSPEALAYLLAEVWRGFPDWLSLLTLALERGYWSEAVCDWLRLRTPVLTVGFANYRWLLLEFLLRTALSFLNMDLILGLPVCFSLAQSTSEQKGLFSSLFVEKMSFSAKSSH